MKSLLCAHIIVLGIVCCVFATDLLAPGIIGLVEEGGTGKYQLVMREAAKRANLTVTERYYPQKRALKIFFFKDYPCIYAYTDLAVEKLGKEQVVASFPIGVFKQYIFTQKGKSVFTSISQLKGKSVGGVLGDDMQPWYPNFTKAGIHLELVASTEQNIKKLHSGRLDAMVSFLPDIVEYVDQLSFAPDHPLLISYDRITCRNTPEGRQFIEKISPVLQEMKHDGTMKKILGTFYLEYDENEILSP